MSKIGIVGYGFVGKGIHKLFTDEVIAIYDPALPQYSNQKTFTKQLDLIVICVPTPESPSGSADTSLIWESLAWLRKRLNKNCLLLIKSTTPPSELLKMSVKYPHLVFSPEFLGESKYFTPPWNYPDPNNPASHTWQIFGGKKPDTSGCVDIFKKRMGVDTRFFQVSLVTASLAKYLDNSFGAMKITFCNEWYEIAKAYGVDYNELRECWLADPRVNRNHTLVFPDNRGYGGKCFPKDTKAIISDSALTGFRPKLLQTIDLLNQKFKALNRK